MNFVQIIKYIINNIDNIIYLLVLNIIIVIE